MIECDAGNGVAASRLALDGLKMAAGRDHVGMTCSIRRSRRRLEVQ
ncbi:hypothetical protein MBELCI_0377 [Limimaricola cinnabarinus LL-001]|uniref:Uncharacterized protein n=1 Tax=Limimaricola cinnabarinus LL-001 TaxID=1337093 RepID=U2YZ35_9RHOB|nr:hypothetical protein MBELCI_0377 [Limimaricola cinnabarinus LL-001]